MQQASAMESSKSNGTETSKHIILSIDVGSSSIRCTAYDFATNASTGSAPPAVKAIEGCSAVRTVSCVRPESGRIILKRIDSQSNQEISLFDDIDACVCETIASLRIKFQSFFVKGVGITTFVMNLIGVNASGELCDESCTLSYACSSPGVQKQCILLKNKLGTDKEKDMYQRTGAPLHNAFALAQLKELYESSDYHGGVARWLTVASICIARWSGRNVLTMPISYSEASWTGLFQFRSCQWDPECLDLLPKECTDALPSVECQQNSECGIHIGSNDTSTSVYLKRWPELSGKFKDDPGFCRFYLGFGDGACANIGSKCTSPDRIAVTIGTSAAARICLPLQVQNNQQSRKRQRIGAAANSSHAEAEAEASGQDWSVPTGLFCYRIDSDTVLLGGALTDGGSVIAWLRELLNLKSDEQYLECQNKASASYEHIGDHDSHPNSTNNLTVVPFLSGERSTGYRGGATGCIMGLTRSTSSADLLRESMESVVLRINAVLELIRCGSTGATDPCIVASGNALEKNGLWRKMLADCSNMNVILDNDAHEGTSRGAALLVAKALSRFEMNASASGIAKEELAISNELEPNAKLQEYWTKKKEQQEAFINQIEPLWEDKSMKL